MKRTIRIGAIALLLSYPIPLPGRHRDFPPQHQETSAQLKLAGKIDAERPVAIVSGGNVAARTASGILGFR